MNTPYKTVVNLKDVGAYATLYDAIKCLWRVVKEEIGTNRMSLQGLETATWIEHNERLFNSFYEARDYAIDAGWAKDGEWIGSTVWEECQAFRVMPSDASIVRWRNS